MKVYGGKPRRDKIYREVWEVQDISKRKDKKKAKGSAEKQSEIGETIGDIRGIKRRDGNGNVFARPDGLRENTEIAISCRGPGPVAKKREVYQ